MAVRIPMKFLADDQQRIILKTLRIQPKRSWFAAKSHSKPDPPIHFYDVVCGDNNEDEVIIPFFYSRSIQLMPPAQMEGAQMRQILVEPRPNYFRTYPHVDLKFTGQLRPNQIATAEQSFQYLKEYGSTIIGLPPGSGKTVIGAEMACRLGLMTAIIVHVKTLPPQWKATFSKFTNAHVWIAGEKHAPGFAPNVVIFMSQQVCKFPLSYRKNFGLVIVDEAHKFCTRSNVAALLGFEPQFVIAETATIHRDDEMHVMIYALCGTHGVFVISQKPFTVYKVETGIEPKVDNASDWHGIKKDLLYRPERNQIIIDLVLKNLQYKILILTLEINHVLLLYEKLKELGVSCDYMCLSKKTYSDSNVLIGTVSKIGTGFDEAAFCPNYNGVPINFLILAGSIKNAALIEQNVGRAFRSEHPIVFDLTDDHPITKRHFGARKKWYLSRNGTINIVRVTGKIMDDTMSETESEPDNMSEPDEFEDWT